MKLRRNIAWELTIEQWRFLVVGQRCHYCNSKLPEAGTGLDRKDNNIGYLFDNSIPCCSECNKIKGSWLTYEEMVEVTKALKRVRLRRKRFDLLQS